MKVNKEKLLELLEEFGLPYEETRSQVSLNLDQVAGYFPFASSNHDTFINFEFDKEGKFLDISVG